MRRAVLALLAVECLAAPSLTAAQEAAPGKELRAYRISGAAPRLDGLLDEDVWLAAPAIDDFTQQEPDNMAAPRERTVVQVAYDDTYLYVAARCYARDPATITAGLGRRGAIPPSDRLGIGLDPRHDHLTGYFFVVNPSGVQSEVSYFNDTQEDADYEAVWEVATAITTQGWNAEFRIPFSQVRFSVSEEGANVWGFQVRRDVLATGEQDFWNATPRGTQGLVSRFGHLVFAGLLAPPRRVELLPFSLVRGTRGSGGAGSRGFDGGLDLRVGLGTSATLSATINPDFGQVEVDPAVLNLTVFETFYPEKRPFFLEDSRALVPPFGQAQTFHSRRIGAVPGRLPLAPNERLASRPDQTTILGAAKLTGKGSGWTYGALSALTSREYATVDVLPEDGAGAAFRRRRLVEPRTSYNVGRVQRDVLGGTSNVGAIATAVVRERDLDAFTGGGDFNLRWDRNLYRLDGHWVVTHAPIDGVKKTGLGGTTNFNYYGKHLGFVGHFDRFGRNYRNTDLGFIQGRVNKNWLFGGVRVSQPDPWKFSRSVDAVFFANRRWTDDGLTIWKNINWWSGMTLVNYWRVTYSGEHNFRAFDDLDTRGGPPIVTPASTTAANVDLDTDSRKQWRVGLRLAFQRDAAGGFERMFRTTLQMQPSGRLQASMSAQYTAARDAAQWIDNLDADLDGEEDHVYGRLRRDVVNITARGTYAFSRDMTLEVFLQPFVAVGDYDDIRKLAQPRSFLFSPVALADDPDFSRKSLRGNVVLRWEYVRGSTLFIVWTLDTEDRSRPGSFSAGRDLRDAFTAPGRHAFVAKLSYWLSL